MSDSLVKQPFGETAAGSVALLMARLLAGGALLFAGWLKLKGGPLVFQLSIDAFKLIPVIFHQPLAYFLPWLEIVVGALLVVGVWGRQSALLAAGLYAAFTLGLASVLLRGMDVDCGCFGGFFGETKVGWSSILRNTILIAASTAVMIAGPGKIAPDRGE